MLASGDSQWSQMPCWDLQCLLAVAASAVQEPGSKGKSLQDARMAAQEALDQEPCSKIDGECQGGKRHSTTKNELSKGQVDWCDPLSSL
jgi:hypothetical protein